MCESHTVGISSDMGYADQPDVPSASSQKCDVASGIVIASLAIACRKRHIDPAAIRRWECLERKLTRQLDPNNRGGSWLVTGRTIGCHSGRRSPGGSEEKNCEQEGSTGREHVFIPM